MSSRRSSIRFTSTVLAVATLLLSSSPIFAMFSDDFVGNTLNPGWTYVHPNPSSTLSLANPGLTMTASLANGGSDLYRDSNYNAPRLLQALDPTADWTVETKVLFDPTVNIQSAGILLTTTNGTITSDSMFNCVAVRGFSVPWGGNWFGNETQDYWERGGIYTPFSGTTTYMRVQKEGTTYTEWCSADGGIWTLLGSEVDSTAYSYIGIDVARQWYDGPDAVATFAYFHAVPEPASLAPLALGAAALLTHWRRYRR
jgi:hypothetical protein